MYIVLNAVANIVWGYVKLLQPIVWFIFDVHDLFNLWRGTR